MQKKQKKKMWIGILVGLGVSVVTLGTGFVVIMLHLLLGGPTEVTTDAAKYEETLQKYNTLHTGLITFPEELPDSAADVDFYFSYKDTWDDPTCEVFLQCTYDEIDYQAEVERLESAKKQYGSRKCTLLPGEEGRFTYPAYIAIDCNDYAFEYALLSGDRQITYIYTSFMNEGELQKIEKKYLPTDYEICMEQRKVGEGYSIYVVREEEWGRVMDYSRSPIAEVCEYHPVSMDYNYFTVCTRLDEEDNEIIQYCAYVYYKNKTDSIYGLPDEIQYEELKGYLFKSVELNADETVATVTYWDGEQEMTKEYVIPGV